jgi:membrane protein DedA with SNARE-associated domain
MATAGSIVGGYVTYRIARNSGKAALERRFASHHIDRFCRIFERWGFGAIAIPALLPPPVPIVPFLFAAGAMQYPAKQFLTALLAGRSVRYTILAYLGARYGRRIVALIVRNGHPVAVGIILVLISIAAAVIYFWPGGKIEKWTWKLGGRSF